MSNALNINQMISSASGVGTLSAMEKSTSPKGIVELLKNIFTWGGVRREKEEQYRTLVKSMADALRGINYRHGDKLPESITIDSFNDHKIQFIPDGEHHTPRMVKVVVTSSEGSMTEFSEDIYIPYETFEKTCNTIAFRAEYNVPQHGIVLTEKGGMYLNGARLDNVTFSASGFATPPLDLRHADLSDSIMNKITMKHVDATGANFKNSTITEFNISDSIFSEACMENSNIYAATIVRSTFIKTNFKDAFLTRGKISDGCKFMNCDMRHSNLSKSEIVSSTIERCDCSDSTSVCVTLNQVSIAHTLFRDADLDYLDCYNSYMKDTDFRGACLFQAGIFNSKPEQAIFDKSFKYLINELKTPSAGDDSRTTAVY